MMELVRTAASDVAGVITYGQNVPHDGDDANSWFPVIAESGAFNGGTAVEAEL